jgi:hypothetical protein
MIDLSKKAQDEQHPEGFVEIPFEVQEVQVIQEVLEAKEIPPEEPKCEEAAPAQVEENLMAVLETLKQEESTLINQKQQLASVGEQLRLRTIEEINKTRERISGLKSEIPELKQKCEAMAKALQIPVCDRSN